MKLSREAWIHFPSANVNHSLASKIEVKSNDDPTQYLTDIENSAKFRFKSVTKH